MVWDKRLDQYRRREVVWDNRGWTNTEGGRWCGTIGVVPIEEVGGGGGEKGLALSTRGDGECAKRVWRNTLTGRCDSIITDFSFLSVTISAAPRICH